MGGRGTGGPGGTRLQQKRDMQHPQGNPALLRACAGREKVRNYQPLMVDEILEERRGSWPNMTSIVFSPFHIFPLKIVLLALLSRKTVCSDKILYVHFKLV